MPRRRGANQTSPSRKWRQGGTLDTAIYTAYTPIFNATVSPWPRPYCVHSIPVKTQCIVPAYSGCLGDDTKPLSTPSSRTPVEICSARGSQDVAGRRRFTAIRGRVLKGRRLNPRPHNPSSTMVDCMLELFCSPEDRSRHGSSSISHLHLQPQRDCGQPSGGAHASRSPRVPCVGTCSHCSPAPRPGNPRAASCDLSHSPHRTNYQDLGLSESQHRTGPSPMVPQASQRPLSLRFEPLFSRTKGVPRAAAPHCACLPSPPTHRQSHQEIWAALSSSRLPRWPPTPSLHPSIFGPNLVPLHRLRSWDTVPVCVSLGRPRYLAICQRRAVFASLFFSELLCHPSRVHPSPSMPEEPACSSLASLRLSFIYSICPLANPIRSYPFPSPTFPPHTPRV